MIFTGGVREIAPSVPTSNKKVTGYANSDSAAAKRRRERPQLSAMNTLAVREETLGCHSISLARKKRLREFPWVGVTAAPRPGSDGFRSEHLSITSAMRLSTLRNP